MGMVTVSLHCRDPEVPSGKFRLNAGRVLMFVWGPICARGTHGSPYFPSPFLFISSNLIQQDLKVLSTALHLIKLTAQ